MLSSLTRIRFLKCVTVKAKGMVELKSNSAFFFHSHKSSLIALNGHKIHSLVEFIQYKAEIKSTIHQLGKVGA